MWVEQLNVNKKIKRLALLHGSYIDKAMSLLLTGMYFVGGCSNITTGNQNDERYKIAHTRTRIFVVTNQNDTHVQNQER